jgi:signal peptidase II
LRDEKVFKTRFLMKKSTVIGIIIAAVLIVDQALKFYIKTHFEYNEEVPILGQDWAFLRFVENEGMAFGYQFGWEHGKLMLSIFRIFMVAGLFWYIRLLLQAAAPVGYVYAIALITAGAIGNIIDSAFYGLIFTESPWHGGLAQLVAPGQGYGTFLHGKVVDMLYFPMSYIHIPEWVPFLGDDEPYLFFSPIFNIADASITTGVLTILAFHRRFLRESHVVEEALENPNLPESAALEDAIEEREREATELPDTQADGERKPD